MKEYDEDGERVDEDSREKRNALAWKQALKHYEKHPDRYGPLEAKAVKSEKAHEEYERMTKGK